VVATTVTPNHRNIVFHACIQNITRENKNCIFTSKQYTPLYFDINHTRTPRKHRLLYLFLNGYFRI